MSLPVRILKVVAEHYPAVIPLLKGQARWIAFARNQIRKPDGYKTYDFFLSTLERLIRSVYEGNLGGEFIDIMANLISGQLTQAFEQAWKDEEGEGDLPEYLSTPLEAMILGQYDHVDQLYRDIVDARVDETPIEPLLARAPLWANRWNEAYDMATSLIAIENGYKEEWVLGETEEHCWICSALNGIVAYAREWDELDIHPQGAPNPILSLLNGDEQGCGGWRCDCSRQKTDKRRSPKAYDTILNIVSR